MKPAVAGRAVLVVEPGGVAVDMAEEGLEPVVDDFDGLAGAQREQTGVDLHREILPAAEGAADPGERHADLVLGQAEDGGDLPEVGVEPLGGDVQLDPAVLGGHGEAGLRAEERLVLHAEDVVARDDHVGALGGLRGVAPHDRLAVDDVRVRDVAAVVVGPVLVDQRRVRGRRRRLVGDERQLRVVDPDLRRGAARGLGVVGGDEGDRFAVVTDLAVGEDGGVPHLQTVGLDGRGEVLVGEYGVHARGGEGLGGVDGPDLGVGLGGAQRVAPQHVLVPQVRGVGELALDLEGAVRTEGGLADPAPGPGSLGEAGGHAQRGTGGGHGRVTSSCRAAASRTASRIFS